jgi:hypothetical protein
MADKERVELLHGAFGPDRAQGIDDDGASPRLRTGVAPRTGGRASPDAQPGNALSRLVRLEQRGWIKGTWRQTESRREAKYYTITPAGRRAVEDQAVRWRQLSALVNKLLLDEG